MVAHVAAMAPPGREPAEVGVAYSPPASGIMGKGIVDKGGNAYSQLHAPMQHDAQGRALKFGPAKSTVLWYWYLRRSEDRYVTTLAPFGDSPNLCTSVEMVVTPGTCHSRHNGQATRSRGEGGPDHGNRVR